MKKLLAVVLIIAVNITTYLAPAEVLADMDYRCLNMCISNGGTGYTCNDQCSYSIAKATTRSELNKVKKQQQQMKTGQLAIKNGQVVTKNDPHKQFSDMYVGNGTLINSQLHNSQATQAKDYQCINQCAQGGMMYGLCQEQCLVPATITR